MPFFLSGQTYFEVLWTPPKGNAYYILAHAYIAAELNFLNSADATAVLETFNQAKALFENYTPDQIAALKGKGANATKSFFNDLTVILDDYNNGVTGPGHCSEESAVVAESVGANKSGGLEANEFLQDPGIRVRNYPNPFHDATTFSFELPEKTEITLSVFTLAGQKISVVAKGLYPAGQYNIRWETPQDFSPGLYLYRMQAGKSYSINKMVIK